MSVRSLQEVQKVAMNLHSLASVMLSHTSHIMLDQGGCSYNNFEYVPVARLKGVNEQLLYTTLTKFLVKQRKELSDILARVDCEDVPSEQSGRKPSLHSLQ